MSKEIELSFIVINIPPISSVTKDKPKHKENHDLKTIEEDCDTFSICTYKSFEKGA